MELRNRLRHEPRLQIDQSYLIYLHQCSIQLSAFWLRLLDQTVQGILEIAREQGHVYEAEYEDDFAQILPNHFGRSNLILSDVDTGGIDVMVIIESNH